MAMKILVVDDNRDTLRTYTKAILRRVKPKQGDWSLLTNRSQSFLDIEEADTVSNAIQKLKTESFEILVVDLKIPGISGEEMGGLEIISESMRLDPLRLIIIITGYGTVELARKTLTQGVFDFIEKSGTAVDDLVNALQRAIDYRNERIIRSGNPFPRMTE